MMKTFTILMALSVAAPFLHADIPSADPTVRIRQYAARTLSSVLRDLDAMDKIAVPDGADKPTQEAAKMELKKKIAAQIAGLSPEARKAFQQLAADQEAALTKQMNEAANPADKDKAAQQLKPYSMLREQFMQASLEAGEQINAARKASGSQSIMLAGIALTLAFATGGLLYARRNPARS